MSVPSSSYDPLPGEIGACFASSATEGGSAAGQASMAASKNVDGYQAGASADSLLERADMLPVCRGELGEDKGFCGVCLTLQEC